MTESGEDSKMSESSGEDSLVSESSSELLGAVGGVDPKRAVGSPVLTTLSHYLNGGDNPMVKVPKNVIKITLIGDEGCGKTTLIKAFLECKPYCPPPPPPRSDESSILTFSSNDLQTQQSSSLEEELPFDEQPESSPENLPLEELPENPPLEEPPENPESPPPTIPYAAPEPPSAFLTSGERGAFLQVKNGTVGGVHDAIVHIKITDIPGSEEEKIYRPPVYIASKVILVCFAIDDPISFANAEMKWLVEANHWKPRVPKVLVGLKQDLRTDEETINRLGEQGLQPISSNEGLELKERGSFKNYIECSAVLPYHNVVEVFEMAVLATNDDLISVTIENIIPNGVAAE